MIFLFGPPKDHFFIVFDNPYLLNIEHQIYQEIILQIYTPKPYTHVHVVYVGDRDSVVSEVTMRAGSASTRCCTL